MRIPKKDRLKLLGRIWLFEGCSGRELDVLQRVVTEVHVPAHQTLTKQGERGQEFLVMVEGKARVVRDGTEIAVLGAGSFFGEMSLLDNQPRAATIVTVEPTRLLALTRAAFTGVIESMPSVDRKMLAVLASRLRDVEAKYVPLPDRTSSSSIA